jgi:hypothetical protein
MGIATAEKVPPTKQENRAGKTRKSKSLFLKHVPAI